MKKVNIFLTILFLTAGCGGNRQADIENEGLITVDVSRSYPQKELILQDFMDVEYIVLETDGEFYTQGVVQTFGEDIVVVKNRLNDGDIFIFDKNGKGLRKFNRLGRGAEEYTFISWIALDEDNNEMFVSDNMTRRILVYDLDGKYKRSLKQMEGRGSYNGGFNFNNDYLICYDNFSPNADEEIRRNSFFIVYKHNGIIKEMEIPVKKKISTVMNVQYDRPLAIGPPNCLLTPYQSNWILTEPSSDTVYIYMPDESMQPFIVRTPSVQSMEPEIFLFPGVLTDRYYFLQTIKKEWDFERFTGLPSTDLLYDRQEKTIFKTVVYNGDYSNEKLVNMFQDSVNDKIAFWQKIEADELVEDFKNGVLKGRLKEIAAGIEEESNPVIMLVKYKK